MANDPVLQRSMFQKQGSSVTPAVGLGTGIGSVTTPDQNAQALRNMFQPTVSIGAPTDMLQQGQPVQSFQEGGLARLLPQYDFRNRNFRLPPSYAQRVAATNAARSFDIDDAEARSLTPQAREELDRGGILPAPQTRSFYAPGLPGLPQSQARRQALEQLQQLGPGLGAEAAEPEIRRRYEESVRTGEPAQPIMVPLPPRRPENLVPPEEAPAAPAQETPTAPAAETPAAVARTAAPERQKGSLELTLDGIRAERAADRRENALLALMQAGFAIAGGRSPNAISNIGAGGQAGIAAFAAMERASREDAAARRREAIQLASAERQFALAERQLEKDPEAIRTYALLGGWTPDQGRDKLVDAAKRGFDFMQTKEAPARAEALLKAAAADPLRGTPGALLSPEETRRLSQFLYGSVTGTLTERGGRSGQPSGPQTFRLDELPRSR